MGDFDWSTQKAWLPGAWLPGAWLEGAWLPGAWLSAPASLLPLNSRIVYFGDSITANRGFPGYADWSQLLSRGRYFGNAVGSNTLGPTGWNQGVVGNITDQLIARISNVVAEKPKVVVVLVGTNDIGASARTTTQITTNLRAIYNTLIAAGATVVALTMIPRIASGWGTAQEATRLAVNSWIMAQPDVEALDIAPAITNPTTQLLSDGTHPNGTGGQLIGQVVAAKLASLISASDILYDPTVSAPAENLFLNPFFTGGTTTATSWAFFNQTSNGLTKTLSKTTLDGSAAQKIVWSGTAIANTADNLNQNITPSGGLAGDLFEAWMEVQVNRYTGMTGISLAAGNNATGYAAMSTLAQDGSPLQVPFTGVLRAPPSPLATAGGTLGARLSFIPAIAAVVDAEVVITRAGYRKVPAGE
jgi:lysophospholipase L1-like esterase